MTVTGHAKSHGPPEFTQASDAATLRRAAAVMGNRRHVADRRDLEADGGKRTQRAFAAGAGALNLNLERLDAMLLRLAAGILGGHLRGIGVDLREPLKPIVPADDQEIALPCTSEIRIFVLLKDEFTCATPAAMFFETLRFAGRRSRAMSDPLPYFFLPAMGFAGPLRVRALVCVR
jgi:hypothetical protein